MREYDPSERFTQVDPTEMATVNPATPQSLNLYSYVRNDPANRVDFSGLDDQQGTADPPCPDGHSDGGVCYEVLVTGRLSSDTGIIVGEFGGVAGNGAPAGGGGDAGTTISQNPPKSKYTCTHPVGPITSLVTPETAMDTMKNLPNVVFPFAVVPLSGQQAIDAGASYDLHSAVPWNPYNPVTVIDSSATSFTFLTLPGHFRGPGQTINFTLYADAGTLYLQQTGTSTGGLMNSIYEVGGYLTWDQQASNLSSVLYGGSRADLMPVCQSDAGK
jgi:hypothetical protein